MAKPRFLIFLAALALALPGTLVAQECPVCGKQGHGKQKVITLTRTTKAPKATVITTTGTTRTVELKPRVIEVRSSKGEPATVSVVASAPKPAKQVAPDAITVVQGARKAGQESCCDKCQCSCCKGAQKAATASKNAVEIVELERPTVIGRVIGKQGNVKKNVRVKLQAAPSVTLKKSAVPEAESILEELRVQLVNPEQARRGRGDDDDDDDADDDDDDEDEDDDEGQASGGVFFSDSGGAWKAVPNEKKGAMSYFFKKGDAGDAFAVLAAPPGGPKGSYKVELWVDGKLVWHSKNRTKKGNVRFFSTRTDPRGNLGFTVLPKGKKGKKGLRGGVIQVHPEHGDVDVFIAEPKKTKKKSKTYRYRVLENEARKIKKKAKKRGTVIIARPAPGKRARKAPSVLQFDAKKGGTFTLTPDKPSRKASTQLKSLRKQLKDLERQLKALQKKLTKMRRDR